MAVPSIEKMDGNWDQLEELYRSNYSKFRGVLSTLIPNPEEAHDAVQEAFARALAARAQFRGEGSLEAWVWKIALRTAGEIRSARLPVPDEASPRTTASPLDEDEVLGRALATLPPQRRLIVFLRYFADLTYSQISSVAGVSEGTVAATLSQARTALASELAPNGGVR